ncbi:MAG: ATP-dependent protease ATPase subunit HslU [Brockia lithotrophica]|nr:ATP-dependent protease ATPase subunit HslU [Brockia lithotrophica]
MSERELTPRRIVEELDKYIVGQRAAKRAVAVALRNRYRRSLLPPELREEIAPKNILMIGPTGVGKTEIARRLARIVGAPFVKVEATKFTEVGYVGRDVESMVRDLVDTAVHMVRARKVEAVRRRAELLAEERLVELLTGGGRGPREFRNPLEVLFGGGEAPRERAQDGVSEEARRNVREALRAGRMEDALVEVEVEEEGNAFLFDWFQGQGLEQIGVNMQEMLRSMFPRRTKRRKLTVREARPILIQEEAQKLIDMDEVRDEALRLAEEHGIIFLDEIDKIAGREGSVGPDVSREGVQRDLLPIVEGSTVMTKYGPVKTDFILFIAAGAFHTAKPSDLIPELQGRFPVRVELEPLTEEDFVRILTEPENALIKQYTALLATEEVTLNFTTDAIRAIARLAAEVNAHTEDIGARRLYTLLEKLLEDVSFEAPELRGQTVPITEAYVREKLGPLVERRDLSRYIL